MESLRENKPLLYSLFFSSTAILCLASGIIPDVAQQFELVDLDPDVSTISFMLINHLRVHLNSLYLLYTIIFIYKWIWLRCRGHDGRQGLPIGYCGSVEVNDIYFI